MSIETEFESTITNVKNAYQGLDNLGATIPQNKTIENIKSCLDEIYNNLPKTDYQEGTEVTLSNTLKGKLDYDNGVVGIGQSSQESTQGYNLANLNGMNNTTNNGVTFTINKENGLTKSVKVNGTSVDYDSYCIGTVYLLPAGTYVVYGNGVTNNIITQIVNDTQTAQLGYSGKDDNTMTLEQDTNIIIRLRVTVGATINNVEVKPIIATTSGKAFEPYTGGYSSPSPNWEQEIKYVRGKNRFNSEIEVGAFNNSGLNSPADNRLRSKSYVEVTPNTTYTLSWATTENARCDVIEYAKNDFTTAQIKRVNNGYVASPLTFTTSSTTNYIRLYIASTDDSSTSVSDISNIQLEERHSSHSIPSI